MQDLFLELIKLSLMGSLFSAAVMIVRLLFRKAPKWIFVLLWGVVALRLVLPLSIESDLSLIPDRLASGQVVANVSDRYIGEVDIIYESNAGYSNALEAGRQPVHSEQGNYIVTQRDSVEAPETVGETVFPVLSWIWLTGVALMVIYMLGSYILLKRKMEEATLLRENIWQCELTGSPFVLGLFHPRIYLPYQISASDMDNVIAHEQAHIRRKDHWWKPVGFLLLSIHWFNPVIWIAYVLLCRDIEAACDEKVINHMSKDEMRAYSAALLNCSVHRRRIAACPLAFGEIGVKERINRVMNYRKPAFWIIVLVVILCAVVAVCFLTTPSKQLGLCNLRYDEMNMPDIMADVSTLDVTYDGVSVVCADEAEINRFLATLDKIQVNSKPISGNRSEDRSKVFSIKVNGNSELNFNESFTEFWVDDHVKPSRTHRITNPETAKELLSDYNLMISSASKGDTPPDPPIATDSDTVAESGNKKVPMVAFPAGTALTAYMPYVHWLTVDLNSGYLVPFEVTKNGHIMFGSYQLFDAETHKQIPVATPSGLSPQTWIFRNAEPNRKYIVTASFSDPDIEYAFGVTLIKSVKMIQYFIPGTEVDRIIYKNFDTKKEIEITKEKEVASILSYLSNMKGVALDSTEGYSGGSCAIHLMDDEFEALSITFTDDTNDWVYCGYAGGDNYPTHFGLQNVTVADVMAYFSQYDTGTSSEANNISEYLTEEGNDQYLILPVSKSKVRVSDLHTQYLDDIDLNLLRTSEEKINGIISQYPKNSGFYVQYYDGYLRLCTEVIVEIDPPESTDISGGCGIDHEHKYFDEPITK